MEEKNIQYNGIEYESRSLIEFSSLARLLFDLAKNQKELENKYKYINERISDKDQRISELELKVLGKSNPNSSISEPFQSKNDYLKKQNNFGSSLSDNANKEKSENKDENIDILSANKINSDSIAKLFKRIRDIEKQLSEMNTKSHNDILPQIRKNHDIIIKSNNQINQLDKDYEEMNKKITTFNEELDKIKIKVEDFNIYDIFKNDSGEGGGVDIAKALIMNLENKVFKKFSFYDEKNKKNESDIFKILEEMKNIKNLIDNFKIQSQRGNEKINDLDKNLNEYINKNDNKIEEITNNISFLEQKMQKGLNTNEMMEDLNKKINNIKEEIKNNINDSINNIKSTKDGSDDLLIKKKFEDLNNAIKEIKNNINEFDKNLNQNINDVKNTFKDKITLLEEEIQKKANLKDLNPINDKIYGLEELTKELGEQIYSLQQYNDKFKSDISNFNKKLEFLNGEFLALKEMKENKKDNSDVNISNLLDQTTFNEYKKENNLKNEKLRMMIEELSHHLKEIESSLNLYSTAKDFSQFQNTFISLLEEFKLNCIRKYMEKNEIHKNLRILENQIKTLAESSKKMDGSDNWLLAKKPLNNYQCASCEAMLKDLEKKDNFVAWNKYPNREEKTYRMGHGFSRMLQMVNEEIIKNIESKENKGYVSDEDKKYINNQSKYNDSSTMYENKSIKLPKVGHKNINNDKYGLTVNKFLLNKSPYEEFDSGSPDEPRISKIYKLNHKKKKLFSFNNKTDSNKNLSVNHGENNYKFKDKTKVDFLQLSMTQPNDKK